MSTSKSDSDRSGEFLIGTLAVALYWVDESLQLSLEAAGFSRQSRTRSMIMLNLSMGIQRPASIAKNIGISREAVHQMLKDMERENIIKMVADPADKRARKVQFSPASDSIREAADQCVRNIETELAKRIGKRTLNQLKVALAQNWGAPVVVPPNDVTD